MAQAGKGAIQVLRGSSANINNKKDLTLLPGQILYNTDKNYITVGAADGNTIDKAPITVRELRGYGDDYCSRDSTTMTPGTSKPFSVSGNCNGGLTLTATDSVSVNCNEFNVTLNNDPSPNTVDWSIDTAASSGMKKVGLTIDNTKYNFPDKSGLIALKSDVDECVKLTGNQTISGVKTFRDTGSGAIGLKYNINSYTTYLHGNSAQTANQDVRFQNASGTVAYLEDIPVTKAGTGSNITTSNSTLVLQSTVSTYNARLSLNGELTTNSLCVPTLKLTTSDSRTGTASFLVDENAVPSFTIKYEGSTGQYGTYTFPLQGADYTTKTIALRESNPSLVATNLTTTNLNATHETTEDITLSSTGSFISFINNNDEAVPYRTKLTSYVSSMEGIAGNFEIQLPSRSGTVYLKEDLPDYLGVNGPELGTKQSVTFVNYYQNGEKNFTHLVAEVTSNKGTYTLTLPKTNGTLATQEYVQEYVPAHVYVHAIDMTYRDALRACTLITRGSATKLTAETLLSLLYKNGSYIDFPVSGYYHVDGKYYELTRLTGTDDGMGGGRSLVFSYLSATGETGYAAAVKSLTFTDTVFN